MPDESASEVLNPPDRALRDGLALAFAVGLVGIVFGVLARSSGLSVAKACAMSLLVFTGASQIAAASVIGAGGTQYAALGSALLLAARNALYGPVVVPWFRESSTLTRVGLAHVVIDESTGMGSCQPCTTSVGRLNACNRGSRSKSPRLSQIDCCTRPVTRNGVRSVARRGSAK